jgi:IS30 family transposase
MAVKRPYHRLGFTPAQSAELWDRWRKGEGLTSIGRLLGKPSSCIFNHLRPSGGIRPPPRRRSRLALSLAEREEISRGLVTGRSLRSMAQALSRSASTLSREIARNGGSQRYRAALADKRAWKQALRPKPCKLAVHAQLRQAVATKLEQNWSPEQIAGWLKRTFPATLAAQVSHETIYRSLYVQARGVLKKELMAHLRTRRPIRRSRHATQKADQCGRIANIVTLVERHSRYVMLAKVPNRETQTVVNALIKQARKLPDELYKSLTWDRGKELADHQRFTLETDIDVYFCDPQSPWQRGSNENTNRLLRQYFPKKTDLAPHSQAHLDKVARQLNERPRKTLDFQTPAERFNECVASTG